MSFKQINIILLGILVIISLSNAAESIKTSAELDNVGYAAVIIDVSETSKSLGSYSAVMTWDPAVLRYVGFEKGLASGFDATVVNELDAAAGKITFAAANPQGAIGAVNVLNVHFERITEGNGSIVLDFSAMASAETFEDLLPLLNQGTSAISVDGSTGSIPKEFKLGAYPNPFNPTANISFDLPVSGMVHIEIYNMLGQKIETLVNEHKSAGAYNLRWNGAGYNSGSYVLRMHSGNFTTDLKIMLVK